MSRESKLLKNTAIISLGKICTQVVSFFLLPLYTAILSTTEFGVVDLLNTLVNLIVPVLSLQLDQGIFRYMIQYRHKEKELSSVVFMAVMMALIETGVMTAAFLVFSGFIHNEYKYFLLFNVFSALWIALMLQIARGFSKNVQYSLASFISGSLTVVLNVVFLCWFRLGAAGMLMASILANGAAAVYLFLSLHVFSWVKKGGWNKELLEQILKYSIPLVPNVISWWVTNTSDRLIISAFLSLSANGIYSAANKFPALILTIFNIFNISWTESAALNIDDTDRDHFFSQIFKKTAQVFGAICLMCIVCMPFVYPVMINKNYFEGFWQVPWLASAAFFSIMTSFIGSVYVGMKLTQEIAKTSIYAAIINILVNLALIKVIGLYAASLSTLAAYFSMFVYRYIDIKRHLNFRFPKKLMAELFLAFLAALVCYYLNLFWLNIGAAGLMAVFACWINRNNAAEIMQLILKKTGRKEISK